MAAGLALAAAGRPVSAAAPAAGAVGPTLTTPRQVWTLSQDEAASGRPVRLEGVVMAKPEPEGRALFVYGAGSNAYVVGAREQITPLTVGDLVTVEGLTDPGAFSPMVKATAIRRIGRGDFPPPRRLRLDELPDFSEANPWIEIRAIVRSCAPIGTEDAWWVAAAGPGNPAEPVLQTTRLEVAWRQQRFSVKVNSTLDPADYVDAEVVVRGICVNQHNRSRQFVQQYLLVSRVSDVEVVTPPSRDPFALPLVSVADLFQFADRNSTGHRTRCRGVVLHHQPGQSVWIRDGDRGLMARSVQTGRLAPGTEVELVGFPAVGNYSPILEDAIFRAVGRGRAPDPIALTDRNDAARQDSDLVALEATVTGTRLTQDGVSLFLRWDDKPLDALLRGPFDTVPGAWLPGAIVRVVGIYAVPTSAFNPIGGQWTPTEFQLLIRSAADVQIVAAAPWWTTNRVVWLLGVLTAGLVAVLVINWLRWRFQLREQLARRATAEAEFSAILNERNRVAREIHDTLAQGLNAVSMQLEVARNTHTAAPAQSLQHLVTAHHITRNALTEARNSIWNMRSQVLEKTDLAGALDGVLRQLAEGSGVTVQLDTKGPARRLPPVVENNLLRIGQEAIANAFKHAHATAIEVLLEFTGKQVRLQVSDNGRGFDPARPAASEKSFGLVGLRERAQQIRGEIEISSTPGKGTRITVSAEVPD